MLIIHSLDKSTVFLSEIPNYLRSQNTPDFTYHAIEPAKEISKEAFKVISEHNRNGLIIFLGHGASHSIYLPGFENDIRKPFINNENFDVLKNRNFISLSCRSAEFIGKNYTDDLGSTMLGFDDLPTHWEDVMAQREVDAKAYSGITDQVLEEFRLALVDSFKKALRDTIYHEQRHFSMFHNRLLLYINRNLSEVLITRKTDNPQLLATILFELKKGIKLFGDGTTKLFG